MPWEGVDLDTRLLLCIVVVGMLCMTAVPGVGSEDAETGTWAKPSGWWDSWNRDADGNGIDDYLDSCGDNSVSVIIDYAYMPGEEELGRLESLGISTRYVAKYIPSVVTNDVPMSKVGRLARLPGVVMVEWNVEKTLDLDVSARAVKARDSTLYGSENVWKDLGFTGDGVTVAVIDSGVDDTIHASFSKKFKGGADFSGRIYMLNTNPDDTNGHGTHTAGTVLGTGADMDQDGDGEYDHTGIAPGADLVDIKVSDRAGTADAGSMIASYEWIIDHKEEYGIRVVSVSMGSRFDSDGQDSECQAANNLVDSGVVFVSSAGNNGSNMISAPASADKVICVGAVDDQDTVDRADDTWADYSNFGPRVDDGDDNDTDELKPELVAPGSYIMAPMYNTYSAFQTMSGTSMSCPHVSGVVALMLEANPDLTPPEVLEILKRTAQAVDPPSFPAVDDKYNVKYGWGMLDAYAAVTYTISRPEPVTLELTGNISDDSIGLRWTQSNDANFSKYELHYSTFPAFSISGSTWYKTISDPAETELLVSGLEPETTYYFKVRVVSTQDYHADSNEVNETTLPEGQSVPVEVRITSPAQDETVSGLVTVSGTATSPEGITRVEYNIDGSGWIRANGTTGWSFNWDTAGEENGGHTVAVRAVDGISRIGSDTVDVVVQNDKGGGGGGGLFGIFETTIQAVMFLGGAVLLVIVLIVAGVLMRSRRANAPYEDYSAYQQPAQRQPGSQQPVEAVVVEAIVVEDDEW